MFIHKLLQESAFAEKLSVNSKNNAKGPLPQALVDNLLEFCLSLLSFGPSYEVLWK